MNLGLKCYKGRSTSCRQVFRLLAFAASLPLVVAECRQRLIPSLEASHMTFHGHLGGAECAAKDANSDQSHFLLQTLADQRKADMKKALKGHV